MIKEEIKTNVNILDLYAGTGILGIEALSLGCAKADFVEINHKTARQLNSILKSFNLDSITQVYPMSTEAFLSLKNKSYDIIFIDPPYGTYDLTEIITLLYKNDWASKTTWVYYETNQLITTEGQFGCYIYKESRAGKVYYGLIRQIDSD